MFHATTQPSEKPTYSISGYLSYQWLLLVPQGLLRAPKTLSEDLQSQNYFRKITKVSVPFLMHSRILQKLQDMWCHNRSEAGAGLSPVTFH